MVCHSLLSCIEGVEISHFVDWYGYVFEGVEIVGRVDWGDKEDTVRALVDAVREELSSKLSKSLGLGDGSEFTIMTRVVDCICELSVFHSDAAVGILEANGFTQQSVKDMILYNANVRGFRRLFEGLHHNDFVQDFKTTIAVVGAGANVVVQRYGFAIVEHLLKWKGTQCRDAEDSGAFGEVLGRLVAKVCNMEYTDSFKPCEVSRNYARTAEDAEGVYMGFLFGTGVSVMCDYVMNGGHGKLLDNAERDAIDLKVACLFGNFMESCLKGLAPKVVAKAKKTKAQLTKRSDRIAKRSRRVTRSRSLRGFK